MFLSNIFYLSGLKYQKSEGTVINKIRLLIETIEIDCIELDREVPLMKLK